MDFSQRSQEKELLDRDDIPAVDIRLNMHELDVINTRLGGHAINVFAVKSIIQEAPRFSILEIGCGGGDNLRAIYSAAKKNNTEVKLTGVDINSDCIEYATQQKIPGCAWMACDYRDAVLPERPDIIFSSLFCHHFSDDELVSMMQWMGAHSQKGFFINDLHRHPLAYHSIRLITKLFSSSYLVKNDAPLSVRRGFTRSEWVSIMQRAGINHFSIQWKWAFRWLIIAYPS